MSFEEFTVKYFNGNIESSLEHLAKESYYNNFELTGSGDALQVILDQLDRSQAKQFMKYFRKFMSIEPSKFRVVLKDLDGKELTSTTLAPDATLTYDEVNNAKVDYYKSKAMKDLLKFVIGASGLLAVTFVSQGFGNNNFISQIGSIGFTAYSSLIAMDLGADLINYFKFKNKSKENNLQQTEDISRGGRR